MFERFTERARQVVVLAQDEARALGHNHIGTEHLLLGLLREQEGIAARVLRSLEIELEDVRAQVVRIVGSGEPTGTGQIPFTPRGKRALELALRESQALGHQYIGTEHLLLGLARLDEGVAREILESFDLDAARIRNEVVRVLGGPAIVAREEPIAWTPRFSPRRRPVAPPLLLLTGWLLFALALGAGILIGWAIWG